MAADIARAGQPFGAGSTREQAAEQLRELREIERALRWCVGMRERRPERQAAYFAGSMGVTAEAVLAQQPRAGVLKPSYILVREDGAKRITLIVRGTHSFRDLFTSLTGASKPHHVADSNGVVLGYAHLGMLASARWLRDEVAEPMERALADNPGYRPLLIGHSLGAGAAAMLCMMLRERPGPLAQTTCIAIACPACMTAELARSCAGYVTTVVNGADVIPTVSPGSADALRASMNASTWAADLRRDVRRLGVVRGIEASVRATASAAIRARAWTGERLAGCVPSARACRVRRRPSARGRVGSAARVQPRAGAAERGRRRGAAAPEGDAGAAASDAAADGDVSSDAPRAPRTGQSLSKRRAASAASGPSSAASDAEGPAPGAEGSAGPRPRPRLAGLRRSLERRSAALATWWARRRAGAASGDSANDGEWSSDDEEGRLDLEGEEDERDEERGAVDAFGRTASAVVREEALGEIAAAAGMLEEEEEEDIEDMEEGGTEEEDEYDEGDEREADGGGPGRASRGRRVDGESPRRRQRSSRGASTDGGRGASTPAPGGSPEGPAALRVGGESPLEPPPLSPEPERGGSAHARRRRSLAEDMREVRRAARLAERANSEERPVVPSVIALGDYGRSARGELSPAQQDARWRRTMYPAGRIMHLVPVSLVPFAEGTWDHVSRDDAAETSRAPPGAATSGPPVVDGDLAAATRAAEAEEAFIAEAIGESDRHGGGGAAAAASSPPRARATPFEGVPCSEGGETPAGASPEGGLLSTPSPRPSRLASLSSVLSAAMRARRRDRRPAVVQPREPHLLLDHVPQTAYGRMKLCRGVLLDHIIPSYLASMETAYANLPAVFQDLMREQREAEAEAKARAARAAPSAGEGGSPGSTTADSDGYIRAELPRPTPADGSRPEPASAGRSAPEPEARLASGAASPAWRPAGVSDPASPARRFAPTSEPASPARRPAPTSGSASPVRFRTDAARSRSPSGVRPPSPASTTFSDGGASPERTRGLARFLSGPVGLYGSKRAKVKEEDEQLSEDAALAVGGARDRAAPTVQQRRVAAASAAAADAPKPALEDPRASIDAAQCTAAASMVL